MSVLNKLFAKALSLEVAGQEISFSTLAEVEFALSGRTDVPAKKIAEMVGLTLHELRKEAKAIKTVEQQFVDVLSRSIEDSGRITQYLRSLDVHVFSQDHHWRDIMRSLDAKDKSYDDVRRIALVKYMQYLRSRQDVIKQTYKVKKRERQLIEARSDTTVMADAEYSFDHDGADPAFGLRDTVIFDSVIIEQQSDTTSEFARLPKGEPQIVNLDEGQRVSIRFSKHAFQIANRANQLVIIDDQNREYLLQEGKNIIGRDSVCNVVIDNVYRDVSRIHLIVEQVEPNRIRFTDLSSHGTFLPHRYLGALLQS
ncbi:MAG: FHA domain-containing protein [Proteobacteria bacterium]|nr:FHA domain-containing protein [Pseudomonadota bacterium]